MKNFIANHPYWSAVILFIINTLVAVPFVALFKILGKDIEPLRLIIPIAQSVVMIGIIYKLGWLRVTGFGTRIKNIHLLWFPVVIAFIPVLLYGTVAIPASGALFYTLAVLFTGISEEAEARGLLLRILLPKGIWVALLGVGFLFSVGHFTNLIFEDFSVLDMAEVLIATFGFAILYGALFLRTLNIWPLIILHALHDFIFVISGTAGPFATQPLPTNVHIVMAIISGLFGAYLVRNITTSSVLAELESNQSQ